MLLLLLKSSICLAVFLVFYKLFLEKERIHVFKRFYLLGALFFAFGIPLVTFTEYVEIDFPLENIQPIVLDTEMLQQEKVLEEPVNFLTIVVWGVYGIGVLLFGSKFIINLFQIISRIRRNPKYKDSRVTKVLLLDLIEPHTFFNYIFLNKNKFEAKQIPKEVLLHEETHARQKHSLDILFIELFQVLLWFNPLIYLCKKAIRLNHEFLADNAVLNQGIELSVYQQILLSFSSNEKQTSLANAINYSSIKKRFTVMKTKTSKQVIRIKIVLLLPVLGMLLFSFSDKEIIEIEKRNAERTQITNIETKKPSVVYSEIITGKDQNQQEITPEQIAAYNKWAKELNNSIKNGKDIRVHKEEVDRMKTIYNMMSPKQRKEAERFPNVPAPTPPITPKIEEKNEALVVPEEISEDIEVYIDDPEIETAIVIDKEGLEELVREVEKEAIERRDLIIEEEIETLNAIAENEAEIAHEIAEKMQIEVRRKSGEISRKAALLAREQAEKAREIAMLRAELVRKEAREASEMARAQAELALIESREAREMARVQAELARKEARMVIEIERSQLEKERKGNLDKSRNKKLEKQLERAQKQIEKGRKKQREAIRKAREANIEIRKKEREAIRKALETQNKATKKRKEALKKSQKQN